MQVALPHGEVYEIALVTNPPAANPALPLPVGRRPAPAPPTPPVPHLFFVYKTFDDTALWTGYLLAAEAFRVAAAADPGERQSAIAATANVITGIRHLFAVTQTPGLPARAALPQQSPIAADPPFDDPPADIADRYYGPVTIDGEAWYGFGRGSHPTSRDSFAGLLFGLTCALTLTNDSGLESAAREMLASMVKFLVGHHFTVPTPVRGSRGATPSRPGPTLPAPAPATRILTHFLGAIEYQLMVLRIARTLATAGYADAGVAQGAALYDDLAPAGAVMWPSFWMS